MLKVNGPKDISNPKNGRITTIASNGNSAKRIDMDKNPDEKSLSKEISAFYAGLVSARSRKDLLRMMHMHLSNIICFNDLCISLVNIDGCTHNNLLYYSESERKVMENFSKIKNAGYRIDDGLFDVTLESEFPVTWNLPEVLKWKNVPEYVALFADTGIQQITGIPLGNEDSKIGNLFILSDTKFSGTQLNLLREITAQITVAVTNIQYNEAMLKRQRNMETLLSLNAAIAAIRDRDGFNDFVIRHLKNSFLFDDLIVFTVNDDKVSQTVFSKHFANQGNIITEGTGICDWTKFPINDGIADAVFSARHPLVWSLTEASKWETIPSYVRFWPQNEAKKMVTVPIFNNNDPLGVMILSSGKEDLFSPENLSQIEKVANQLSTTLLNIRANEAILEMARENSVLRTISNDLAGISKENMLFRLHELLIPIFHLSHLVIAKIDINLQTYTGFFHEQAPENSLASDHRQLLRAHYPLSDSIMKGALSSKDPVVFDMDELLTNANAPDWIKLNYQAGIEQIACSVLNAANKPIGFLVIFSAQKNLFQQKPIKLLRGISYQLSTIVANIFANEEILERENEKSILLDLSYNLSTIRNKPDLYKVLAEKLKKMMPVSHMITCDLSEDGKWYSPFISDLDSKTERHQSYPAEITRRFLVNDGLADAVLSADQPLVFDLDEVMKRPGAPKYLSIEYENGIKEAVFSPLSNDKQKTGILIVYMNSKSSVNKSHLSLIQGVSAQLSIVLSNISANEKIEKQLDEINQYKHQLEEENLYLQEEIQTTHNYSEIVGTSSGMKKVFQLVSQVSDTQSTVLILGETGTGKELIARALHNTSPRKNKLMVKVNCAAIPANLIESELFGHEKGSFTGASERRIGKFELANNSTLFLDEVGELPPDLQVKLLRALQEREIERVGGRTVIKTDVRVIAATNRNLQKEVQLDNFRSDLYFRLNVFPIFILPLRDRKEDIPGLASHFLLKHSKKGIKGVMGFSSKAMKQLTAYDWPGNVRELENLIERSILLTNSNTISEVHLPNTINRDMDTTLPDTRIKTIDEVEREHIIAVLRKCKGKVAGIGGAAEKLRIPSTTLNSKIRRLNIQKGYMDGNR